MTEITRRFVEADGLRVHLAEAGDGPLVLLLHGFPETSYNWRHQMAPLAAAGYHVVAPDQRGYGRTSRPERIEDYTILHLVGDVVALIEALGERQAVVVGHDWGGPVAWHTAMFRPDLVRGVVSLSSPIGPRSSRPPLGLLRARLGEGFYMNYFQQPGVADPVLERDLPTTFRRIMYGLSGEAPALIPVVREGTEPMDMFPEPDRLPGWLSEDDIAAYAAGFAESGFTGPLNWYRNLDRNWALTAAFDGARITPPALFIGGDKDLNVAVAGPDMAARMRAVVPDLRDVVLLRDTGHWVAEERPAEVNAHLIDFLKSL
ncbi:alpha/beta fold hydrolase [Streptomyces sp. NPDC001222]|uniref:alpha/beta fold hydrolase n=1 Tax=Streptomyces sp. NPDC001222 TaxID=3364548 RepID=UPI0036CFD0E5